MKSYKIIINSEEGKKCLEELEVLQAKIDSKVQVVENMMYNRKNDIDTSLFESAAWKGYNDQLNEIMLIYNRKKNDLSDIVQPIIFEKEKVVDPDNFSYNWTVFNFERYELQIDIID